MRKLSRFLAVAMLAVVPPMAWAQSGAPEMDLNRLVYSIKKNMTSTPEALLPGLEIKYGAVSQTTPVEIITASSLDNVRGQSAVSQAVVLAKGVYDTMHQVIERNRALTGKLDAAGFSATDVVAGEWRKGTLYLYVNA